MNPPIGQNAQNQGDQNQGGQRDGQGGPQDGNGDGNGAEDMEMEMGKVGEDSLPWLIRMLLNFLPHGTPLHQTRLRIILSRRQSVEVQPRMCNLLRC
jgi:hypothetical protein